MVEIRTGMYYQKCRGMDYSEQSVLGGAQVKEPPYLFLIISKQNKHFITEKKGEK